MSVSDYVGLGGLSFCPCRGPWRGVAGMGGVGALGAGIYVGNNQVLNPATGEFTDVPASFAAGFRVGESVPTSAERAEMATSVPGSSTTIGEDISSGIKSFFGATGQVTQGVMSDPFGRSLVTLGLSQLVPGGTPRAPAPAPASPPIPWGTVALVGAGGLAVVGVGLALSKSSSPAPRRENPRRRRRRRFGLRRGR